MIILMGVAGAGKSLQGQLFVKASGYEWLSTGEIFRRQLPPERQKELLTGKLLDDQEVIELVDKELQALGNNDKKAVLDGFPRTVKQAEWLLSRLGSNHLNIKAVFNLTASRQVVKERLLSRGRADDNEEIIKERFSEYENKTLPIIKYFKERGVKVYDIDADQTPEEVHQAMISCLV